MEELVSKTFEQSDQMALRPRWKARALWFVVGMIVLGTIPTAIAWLRQPIKLQGRILTSGTKQPIKDALVAVESTTLVSDKAFGSYVTTDEEGRFIAEARGDKVSIRAWKAGYVMNGVDGQLGDYVSSADITVELRELDKTSLVSPRNGVFYFGFGDGFSLSEGRVVQRDTSAADFEIKRSTSPLTISIEAKDKGGLMFQPNTDVISFANSPYAPEVGYDKQVTLDFSPYNLESGFLFVRTSDGNHFAKVSIGLSTVDEKGKGARLDLEQGIRLTWAYQSDGSRNLELDGSRNIFFPVSKFSSSGHP